MHKNPNEDRVLDHIREIPGMERMAVVHGKPPAEAAMVSGFRRSVTSGAEAPAAWPRPKPATSASLACERGAFSLTQRRHDHLVATARMRIDIGTSTETKIPADADAYLAQSSAVAGDRNAIAPEPRIGFYKSLLDLIRSYGEHLFEVDEFRGYFHHRPHLANAFEIGVRGLPRTGAVPVPLLKYQPRRGHQIKHGRDYAAVDARRRHLAKFRKPALILRP